MPSLELLEDRVNPDGQLLPIYGYDHAFDDLRHVIYAVNGTEIQRYSLVSQQALPSWSMGASNQLGGIDITPDDRYLMVATSFNGVLKVDLNTGAFTNLTSPGLFAYDIAMLSSTKGIVSSTSTAGYLYDIDLNTDTLTPRPDWNKVGYYSYLQKSADGSKVLLTDYQHGPLAIYDTATNSISTSQDVQATQKAYYSATNRNGTQFVQQLYDFNIAVFDKDYLGIESKHTGSKVVGIIFDPVLDRAYFGNEQNNTIDVYETVSWKRLYSMPIGADLRQDPNVGPFGLGSTSISSDGHYLLWNTDTLRLFQLLDPETSPATALKVDKAALLLKQGEAGSITVTARNANGDIALGFTGRVHFSSTDPGAVVPADYTFTTADRGQHEFPVSSNTVGSFTVTVQLVSQPAISATSSAIAVHNTVLTTLNFRAYDMVYDSTRNMMYFTAGTVSSTNTEEGLIYRYDIARQCLLSPIVINSCTYTTYTYTGDMEISPDGRYLYVIAPFFWNITQNCIRRIEIDTGLETNLRYDADNEAIQLERLSDGSILIARDSAFDVTYPLLQITADGNRIVRADYARVFTPDYLDRQRLEVSPDRSTFLFSTNIFDSSSHSTYLFHVGETQPLSSHPFQLQASPITISRNNDRFGYYGYYSSRGSNYRSFLLDESLGIVAPDWPTLDQSPAFMAPDPVRDWFHTYVVSPTLGPVDRIMSVVDGSTIADIPIAMTLLSTPGLDTYNNGNYTITNNGLFLFQNNWQAAKVHIYPLPVPDLTYVSVTGGQITEGNSGTRTLNFVLTLSKSKTTVQEVSYRTVNGTAQAGSDYLATIGTVLFQPGETQKIISVPILGDTVEENDESFNFEITRAAGEIRIATGTATGIILSDDTTIQIQAGSISGVESIASLTLTIQLSTPLSLPVQVSFALTGTATPSLDYLNVPASGIITFAPGETSKVITFSIVNDNLIEPNETITVNLTNAVNANISTGTFTYTILDDDQLPTIQFVDSASQGSEASTQVFIPIKLNIPYVYPVTVKYSVIGGTAQAGFDYTLPDGQITFAPGETNKVVSVTIINDTLSEDNESIVIYVQPVVNALYGQQSVHVYTILDDDPPVVGFASSNGSGLEGGSSDVIVYLSKIWTQPVTVNLSLAGGSALLGTDYTINLGPVTFAAGEVTKSIPLSTIDDAMDELNESAVLMLTQPVNATLVQGTFTYTILDNDPPPRAGFERQTSSGSEATSNAVFTVLLTEASSLPVTVNYATMGGTATAGADYISLVGGVNFAPGETSKTITLTVLNDQVFEPNETVVISLTGTTNASLNGNSIHTYTIIDDDTVKVEFDQDASHGLESLAAPVIWVRLAAAMTTTTQVSYSVTGGTATKGPDFTLNNGTLVFSPGQTAKSIPLNVLNDVLDEDNETVVIQLSNPVGGIALGAKALHTYTIDDNDNTPTVSFSSTASSLVEANANVTVTVKLSTASGRAVDVNYARTGGTATPDADYVFSDGSLHFNPGEVSKTFAVKVLQDALDENDETLILALNSPVNVQLGTATKYTLTIKDDDAAPKVGFALAGSTTIENAGYVDIVIQLSAPSGKAITVKVSAGAGSTALVNKDYQPFAGTLTFNPGETHKTVRINLINDAVRENTEILKLLLSLPTNATLGVITQHSLTLRDDD